MFTAPEGRKRRRLRPRRAVNSARRRCHGRVKRCGRRLKACVKRCVGRWKACFKRFGDALRRASSAAKRAAGAPGKRCAPTYWERILNGAAQRREARCGSSRETLRANVLGNNTKQRSGTRCKLRRVAARIVDRRSFASGPSSDHSGFFSETLQLSRSYPGKNLR